MTNKSIETVDKYPGSGLSVEWFQWLGALLLVVMALAFTFRDGLLFMIQRWSSAEYSHGYAIPLIALFLAWQKTPELSKAGISGSWSGAAIVFMGVSIFALGELGTIYTVIQYSFLLTLCGLVLAAVGWRNLRTLWASLTYLVFMVPLPEFLYARLSNEMQLIASALGVAIIRLFGISVFLDGNVIDLGELKLQIVEACDGLRYLFPLMSFGFLVAYIYKGALWHRAVIMLSTIPIAIFMNSLRIGVMGVIVEHFGAEAAQGFLHYLEGWVVFMACVAVLFFETWLFNMIGHRRPFWDIVYLDFPKPNLKSAMAMRRAPSAALVVSIIILLVAAVGSVALSQRTETLPDRKSFTSFPMRIGEWQGQRVPMDKSIIYAIKVDDWLMTNYVRPDDYAFVNLYIAYYASQRKGASAHSPRSCIPGGGWTIEEIDEKTVPGVLSGGGDFAVNRAIITKGEDTQVVYYWFQQRDRLLTNEYLVKWYLFWDAVYLNRTDGALVRVMTPIFKGEDVAQADQRLIDLIQSVFPRLDPYFPST